MSQCHYREAKDRFKGANQRQFRNPVAQMSNIGDQSYYPLFPVFGDSIWNGGVRRAVASRTENTLDWPSVAPASVMEAGPFQVVGHNSEHSVEDFYSIADKDSLLIWITRA
jgi:hypothetical protein